ncbi:MAG TPA: hypothetical protein VFV47_03015 [Hyphomicrobiaceae bacterium]|nr:hypothetical protein [Hyphomicrobiaceae bacterium]
MRVQIAAIVAFALIVWPACAQETASFLGDGVYTLPGGCAKLARIARGGPKNVQTTPETLNAQGFESWEASCEFTRVNVEVADRVWTTEVKCTEGPDEWTAVNRFEKIDADTFNVTVDGETSVYKRCDANSRRPK